MPLQMEKMDSMLKTKSEPKLIDWGLWYLRINLFQVLQAPWIDVAR